MVATANVYFNPKADPLYSILKEYSMDTDILTEGSIQDVFTRIKEFFKGIIKKIKDVIKSILGKLKTEAINHEKWLEDHKDKMEDGYKMISASKQKLAVESIYTPKQYLRFTKDVQNYTKSIDSGNNKYIDDIRTDVARLTSLTDGESIPDSVLLNYDPKDEYSSITGLFGGQAKYRNVRENLEEDYKAESSSNYTWTQPSMISNVVTETKTCSTLFEKIFNSFNDTCNDAIKAIERAERDFKGVGALVHGNTNKEINHRAIEIMNRAITLYKDRMQYFTSLLQFNNVVTASSIKFCMSLAKIYVEYSKKDTVEGNGTITIGSSQSKNESTQVTSSNIFSSVSFI